jgi:CO dehydrogenase maturation factor
VGSYFKLNPKVEDIPEKFCLEDGGVRLIVMGMVTRGGAGCACPENAFLKNLLSHLLLGPDEDIVVDMEAGLEHLGRATVYSVDALLVVVEPTLRSLDTLDRVVRLAEDIGLKRVLPVANKIESEEDRAFLREKATGREFIGWAPFSRDVVKANRGQLPMADVEPAVRREVDSMLDYLASALSPDHSGGQAT